MKRLYCLIIFLGCFAGLSYAQTDTLRGDAAKDIISQLKMDSSVFLRSAAELCCKCIDSVDNAEKDKAKKIKAISGCTLTARMQKR